MATRERPKFAVQFKREAVKLAEQPGRALTAVASELDIGRSVLKRRTQSFAAGKYEKDAKLPLKSAQQQENRTAAA